MRIRASVREWHIIMAKMKNLAEMAAYSQWSAMQLLAFLLPLTGRQSTPVASVGDNRHAATTSRAASALRKGRTAVRSGMMRSARLAMIAVAPSAMRCRACHLLDSRWCRLSLTARPECQSPILS